MVTKMSPKDDVELAGFSGAQLDAQFGAFRGALLFEVCPHTEGLRLITSSAAIFDQDLHTIKVEVRARAIKGDIG